MEVSFRNIVVIAGVMMLGVSNSSLLSAQAVKDSSRNGKIGPQNESLTKGSSRDQRLVSSESRDGESKRQDKPGQSNSQDKSGQPNSQKAVKGSPNALVSLQVKDSTIGYIAQALAKQAGVKLVYKLDNNELKKRVSVNVASKPLMEALGSVLRGTSLSAKIATDGETVMLRSEKGDNRQDTTVKGAISGRIIDSATGKGIPGALVTAVGTSASYMTDANGLFYLTRLPGGKYTVNARIIGYKSESQTVTIGNGEDKTISIVLVPSASVLSEVVTTAVGQQKRLEVGNDIVKVKADELLSKTPARSVSEMLRYAHIPGVQVTPTSGEPGAPSRIRMRGIGSMSQSSDPAIIVDGVWISSDMSSERIQNQTGSGLATPDNTTGGNNPATRQRYASSSIDAIDPTTIESIEVIRGPSAATLYGQEAANGVIVITTKKGKPGKAEWGYQYSRDWNTQPTTRHGNWVVYGRYPMSNQEFECNVDRYASNLCVQDSIINLNSRRGLGDGEGPGREQKHAFSVRGGSNSMTYSFNAVKEGILGSERALPSYRIRMQNLNMPLGEDMIKPSYKDKTSLNSVIGFNPTPLLQFTFNLNGTVDDNRQNGTSMRYDKSSIDTQYYKVAHMLEIDEMEAGTKSWNIVSAVSGSFRPTPMWSIQSQLGLQKITRNDRSKTDKRTCAQSQCVGTETQLRSASLNEDIYTSRLSVGAMPSTRLDKFISFQPSVGVDVRSRIIDDNSLASNATFGSTSINSGFGSTSGMKSVTAGWYINTGVKLLNRLYFDLGVRQDVGSAIKVADAGRYPKLSTSWVVSEEGFFPKNNWISTVRLRGAMGHAAVHPEIADIDGGYTYIRYPFDGVSQPTALLKTIGNNKLVPERSVELEGGIDIYGFSDRLTLSYTLASKKTRNSIVQRVLPPSGGLPATSRKENIGRVANTSAEFSLSVRPIQNDNVSIELGMSMSNINNVIKKLNADASLSSNLSTARLEEGYQIASVWMRPVLGYNDMNGDGFITSNEILRGDTTVYMGWSMPELTSSYFGTVSLLQNSISISADVGYKGKHVQTLTYLDNWGLNSLTSTLDEQAFSLAYLYTGVPLETSEIRLNSASISYTIPRQLLGRFHARMVRVSLMGSNLGLWTDYKGRDPLVNSSPVGNALSDNGYVIPIPRKYALQFKLDF